MVALALVSAYLFLLAVAAATAKGARSPIAMTEHGSAVLVWLEKNPRPGTPSTRKRVALVARSRVWRGLRLAGVAWLYRGDVDARSPFGCIHHHEGAWTIHNPPYDGGLQMDSGFQSTYGREYIALWGSAGHWPIWAQVNAAFRAHQGYHGFGARGYGPWPNTARYCGLL